MQRLVPIVVSVFLAAAPSAHATFDPLLPAADVCADPPRSASLTAQRSAARCLLNGTRINANRTPWAARIDLHTAATRKSADLDRCSFSHTACGREVFFWTRKSIYGRNARQLGENLFWGSGERGTIRFAVDAWLKSPPHRAILISRTYRNFGVGRKHAGDRTYWTLQVGTTG